MIGLLVERHTHMKQGSFIERYTHVLWHFCAGCVYEVGLVLDLRFRI